MASGVEDETNIKKNISLRYTLKHEIYLKASRMFSLTKSVATSVLLGREVWWIKSLTNSM
jgi:hypothetical protein